MSKCPDPKFAEVRFVPYKPPTRSQVRAKLVDHLKTWVKDGGITARVRKQVLADFDARGDVYVDFDESGQQTIRTEVVRVFVVSKPRARAALGARKARAKRAVPEPKARNGAKRTLKGTGRTK